MALQLVDPDVGAVISRALTAPEAASLAAVLAHNDLKSLAGLKSLSEKEWSELRVNSGLSIGKMGKVKREVEAAPDPIAPLAPSAMPQRLTPAPADGPTAPRANAPAPGGIDPRSRPWATPKPPPPEPPMMLPQQGQVVGLVKKVPMEQIDPRKDARIVVDDAWKAQIEALLSVARSEIGSLRDENRDLKTEIQRQKVRRATDSAVPHCH